MGKPSKTSPVKLIVGLIYKQKDVLEKGECALIKRFGKIDFRGPEIHFDYTDYYEKEFGKDLKRKFLAFKKLIGPQELSKIKLICNNIETEFSKNTNRLINIDPGYVDFAKLVLASTKDYSHRIYLESGIFAEITLVFKGTSFRPWTWTYPDYKSREYITIFNSIRQIYAAQTKIG